jgi:hypothetical protein
VTGPLRNSIICEYAKIHAVIFGPDEVHVDNDSGMHLNGWGEFTAQKPPNQLTEDHHKARREREQVAMLDVTFGVILRHLWLTVVSLICVAPLNRSRLARLRLITAKMPNVTSTTRATTTAAPI